MNILPIFIVLIVVGVLLWGVQQLPIAGSVQRVIQGVAVFLLIVWLLQAFGFLQGFGHLHFGRSR